MLLLYQEFNIVDFGDKLRAIPPRILIFITQQSNNLHYNTTTQLSTLSTFKRQHFNVCSQCSLKDFNDCLLRYRLAKCLTLSASPFPTVSRRRLLPTPPSPPSTRPRRISLPLPTVSFSSKLYPIPSH
jgi:hypothetical protein